MIVVACRVVTPSLDDTVVGDHPTVHDSIQPLLISPILTFFIIIQTVEAHILLHTRTLRRGKGVGLGGLLRNLSPLCGRIRFTAVNRHTALIELLAIAQDILAHLAEVDIEIAGIV